MHVIPRIILFLAGCTDPNEDVRTPEDTSPAPLPLPALVPLPASVVAGEGAFTLDADTTIGAAGDAEGVGTLLAEALRPATGLPLPVADEGDVTLRLDAALGLPDEGYTLDVGEDGVVVEASAVAGLYWGTMTLRQLLPAAAFADEEQDADWILPAVHVEDAPRFAWRGFMLDVARHFFTVEDVERQIDLMALHKLNRLHLHLTDDQGWRIEITSWPDLTEIGGSTEVGGGAGGWYTQDDYAAIVAYAEARQIVVVPEVDFPGHANAALASYAELNEDGVAEELYTGEGVISTPLWVDGELTAAFVADVWSEVAALTPGPWLHVGGDEAIDVSAEGYDAFLVDLQALVDDEGKTLIGWDEVGVAPLSPPFLAQYWYDEDNAQDAVALGGQLVASPAEHTYLDMVHDRDAEFGQVWAGAIDVERAYDWEPVPDGLDEADVLGVEGALWTEFVDTTEKLEFMAWPRLVAHAEVGWTPAEERVWDDFRDRLGEHGARLDALGVGYYASPEIDWD